MSTPDPSGPEPLSSPYGPMFFMQGRWANQDVSQEKLDRAIQVIRSYRGVAESRGIRFIFLPIPNKENIFYECLGTRRPVFLEQLISQLKRHGVETVDTQRAFERASQKEKVLLYHTDDTHWNGNAVRITAGLIKELIQKKK